MKSNKVYKTFISVVLTAGIVFTVAGCGTTGRRVEVDTDVFGGGNGTSAPATSQNNSWGDVTDGQKTEGTNLDGIYTEDTGTHGQSLEQLLAKGEAVQQNRAVLDDPLLGCEAVRSFMPAGWTAGGEVSWAGQSCLAPSVIDFHIDSPDGAQRVGWISPMWYTDNTRNVNASGSWNTNLDYPIKFFESPEAYAAEIMNQLVGTTGQVTNVTPPTDSDLQALQEMQGSYQQVFDQLLAEENQMLSQYGQRAETQVSISGAYVDMQYNLDGGVYNARVGTAVIQMRNTHSAAAGYGIPAIQLSDTTWGAPVLFYYFAEQSQYDETGSALTLFAQNLVVNQQWQGAVEVVSNQIMQENADGIFQEWQANNAAYQQQAQAYSASASQDYSSTIENMSETNSNAFTGWGNTIAGNTYYESEDGGAVLLDSSYYHTYHDGSGNFIQSNTPIAGLDEATDLGTIPGGW
jgi:hypothetical protein